MRELSVESIDRAKKKTEISLKVFLGGPFIKPDVEPDEKSYGGAALLRYSIYHYLSRDLEFDVTIGENVELERLYREDLEDLFEAATMEFAHVADHRDAVIIFPSSPGSFCELGYFSASDVICAKMLILLSDEFSANPGYLHYGPTVQAKNYGAIVETVNYKDIEQVKRSVYEFMKKRRSRALAQRYRISK